MRLTKELRNEIARAAMAARFDGREEELSYRRREFASKVYHHIFSKREIDLMYSLPEGWLPETDNLRIRPEPGLPVTTIVLDSRVRVPFSRSVGSSPLGDGDLQKERRDIRRLEKELDRDRREYLSALETALAGFSTTSKLQKAWPEVAAIWVSYLASTVTKVRSP
jgi:hypothetical protein